MENLFDFVIPTLRIIIPAITGFIIAYVAHKEANKVTLKPSITNLILLIVSDRILRNKIIISKQLFEKNPPHEETKLNEQEKSKKSQAIVELYFDHERKNNLTIIAIIFGCFSLLTILNRLLDYSIPLVQIGCILLLFTILIFFRLIIISYRISNVFYGTNRNEFLSLIKYINKNSDDIDFTDGGNNRRKVFPEETFEELKRDIEDVKQGEYT
jgi:hypothetical protein